MDKAYKTLEELSMEPSARELAEMREKSRINLQIITTETEARAKAEGIAVGKAEGIAVGKVEGKNEGIALGKLVAQRELILKFLQNGMSIEQVGLFIGMKTEEIQNLLEDV